MSISIRLSSVLPIIVALGVTVGAQTSPSIRKDARAISVAIRALTATGRLPALSTVEIRGTITLFGNTPVSYPIRIISRGSRQVRAETTKPDGLQVTIINNGIGQAIYPNGKVRNLSSMNLLGYRASHVPSLSLLQDYQSPNTVVEDRGTNQLTDGSAVDTIAVAITSQTDAAAGREMEEYSRTVYQIDSSTGLLREMTQQNYLEHDSTSPAPVVTRFSDYRRTGPVQVPYRQECYLQDKLIMLLVVDTVAFDVTTTDAAFTVTK
jgi:hypothetical protein